MAIQSITTLPALAVTVGSAQLRGEIVLGPSWPDSQGYIYNEGQHEEMWVEGYADTASREFVKNTDHLYLRLYDAYEWAEASIVTDAKVNLTGVSSVNVEYEILIAGMFFVDGSSSLNVSSISGEWFIKIYLLIEGEWMFNTYLGLAAGSQKSSNYYAASNSSKVNYMVDSGLNEAIIKITKIWLE